MSTRGAYGFFKDGQSKLTYNHMDSYPRGLGMLMLQVISGTDDDELEEAFNRIELIPHDSEGRKLTGEEYVHVRKYVALPMDMPADGVDWYTALRDIQGELMPYVNGLKYMIDNKGFMGDSLFCEWAYVINLDDKVLEVYKGSQKKPDPGNRYSHLARDKHYCEVKLIETIPFEDCRNDFQSVRLYLGKIEDRG